MADYAEAWNKWFPMIERAAAELSRCMLDTAGVTPGQRILDLATGVGEPALSAAGRVGPNGHVLGVDSSSMMIDLAISRVRAADVGNAEFRVGDIEALDLPPESFDAVLCRWGLMFVDDLAGTLNRMCAVLRRGGRLSVSVWASADHAPTLSLAARVAHQTLGLPPPDEGEKTAFALRDAAALMRTLENAGFDDVRLQRAPVIFEFAAPEEYVDYRREVSTPLAKVVNGRSETDRERAWRAVTRAVEAYRCADGAIRMENQAYCISAGRP